jgi:hypothetical protein
MKQPLWFSSLVAIWLASACGGSKVPGGSDSGPGPGSTTSVNGSVGGFSLSPVSSFAVATTGSCPLGSFAFALIGISDYAASCSAIQSQVSKAGSTSLTLAVIRAGSRAQQPIVPGAYNVSATPTVDLNGNFLIAQASFEKLDSNCRSQLAPNLSDAQSGTIVITSIGDSVSGTFDLTFPNSNRLSGTFNSLLCSVSVAQLCSAVADGGVSATCQP